MLDRKLRPEIVDIIDALAHINSVEDLNDENFSKRNVCFSLCFAPSTMFGYLAVAAAATAAAGIVSFFIASTKRKNENAARSKRSPFSLYFSYVLSTSTLV